MNILLLILGIIITVWALLEGLWTTIWVDGNSAPITGRLTTLIWRTMRKVIPSKKHRILSLGGPIILATTVFSWIIFLWLGWVLIFYSDSTALNVKDSSSPADFSDVTWYIAFCMFTIGNGDFKPIGDIWQILSSFVGLTGMLMVTLSVTYILQIVSAVVNKRSFASQVISIGKSAEEFVIRQWNGKNFGSIELQLNTLSSQLSTLKEQHMAFPILHYYHAAEEKKSNDVAIAILDDALTLIEHGVKEEHQPAQTILSSSRDSISSFLETVKSAFISASDQEPPEPKLAHLSEKGLPTVPEDEFYKKLDNKAKERRKILLGLTQNGSWEWPSN